MRSFMREKKIYCGKHYREVDIYPYVISKKFADELEELSYQCRHFLNTRSAFTTPAAEDEEEPDENQTTAFDAETAEVQE